jgi:hypothetical protein
VSFEHASSIHCAIPNISIPARHRNRLCRKCWCTKFNKFLLVEEMRLGSASRASRFFLSLAGLVTAKFGTPRTPLNSWKPRLSLVSVLFAVSSTANAQVNTVPIPQGAQEIDLSKATVLPGLIDGHTHVFGFGPDGIKRGGPPFASVGSNAWAL